MPRRAGALLAQVWSTIRRLRSKLPARAQPRPPRRPRRLPAASAQAPAQQLRRGAGDDCLGRGCRRDCFCHGQYQTEQSSNAPPPGAFRTRHAADGAVVFRRSRDGPCQATGTPDRAHRGPSHSRHAGSDPAEAGRGYSTRHELRNLKVRSTWRAGRAMLPAKPARPWPASGSRGCPGGPVRIPRDPERNRTRAPSRVDVQFHRHPGPGQAAGSAVSGCPLPGRGPWRR